MCITVRNKGIHSFIHNYYNTTLSKMSGKRWEDRWIEGGHVDYVFYFEAAQRGARTCPLLLPLAAPVSLAATSLECPRDPLEGRDPHVENHCIVYYDRKDS